MNRRHFALLASVTAWLCGCATAPYDIEVSAARAQPDTFYVKAQGTRFADPDAVTHSWHKRAEQICPDGYDSIINPPSVTAGGEFGIADPPGGFDRQRVTGYVRCK